MKKYLFIAMACIISACTKTGPEGPQGATGNANVIVASDVANFTAITGGYKATLTNSNVNTYGCAVMLYLAYDANTSYALPVSNFYSAGDEFSFSISSGQVNIYYLEGQANQTLTSLAFNLVIIPQAIIKKHPSTDWSNGRIVAQLPEVANALKN